MITRQKKSRNACEFRDFLFVLPTGLLAQAERLDDGTIAINGAVVEIIKQSATLTNELCQRTRGDIVFVMGLHMFCQVLDAEREQRNLTLCRARVGGRLAVLAEDLLLFCFV